MPNQNDPELPSKMSRLNEKDSDNELLDVKVEIPDDESTRFSWRKLWAFTGPGFLMSIAFLDPGNIEADLQSGAVANYELFWVLLWSTILGLLVQRLSARIGTVTGQHMAEICYTEYRFVPRIFLWLMLEIAIIGSDMQEVVGTAIALYLLSNGKIPIWGGVLITVIDTFTFLFLDKYGLRKLELFFAILIAIMAVTFGYEFAMQEPLFTSIAYGTIVPQCSNCDSAKLLQAVGIIGSCIMPHNLYLHSGLVKTRSIDRTKNSKISEANFYFLIESALALALSFFINVFVMSVFAEGLYHKTNQDVKELCLNNSNPYADHFPNNTESINIHIYESGLFLGCKFGMAALYIWAIGILAAGQSSTMTGCYAGQFVMEGFLNLTWVRWKRVLFTRSIAVVPSFLVAYNTDMGKFSDMNDLLNALMSIQLPFAVLPAIAFSSNMRIMGEFSNGVCNKIIALLIFILIFAVNTILVITYVDSIDQTWLLVLLAIYFVLYIIVCIYLILHCLAALFSPDSCINRSKIMRKYILGQSITEYHDQKIEAAHSSSHVNELHLEDPSFDSFDEEEDTDTSPIMKTYVH
ncbi:unnamed protein product [Nezara viridula]|uniref:Uncharacterized protein n=1 Tax=Nezara viridula TaxID=85310 RepID=A0A9P0MTV9_NEZVI|nr:unnamed protein product [Nezara viridula]